MAGVTGNEKLIGQRLGRYRITSSLGCGGMAEVFQAGDDRLGREVAIKVVLPAFASEPQSLQRFLREARVVASLEHPNILPVYDFGDHEGLPFLVLPLIRGGTLAEMIDGGALEAPRIAVWIRNLARALDAAHEAGVLHRDVKPGNVLVGRDEHLFLADFGIARLQNATRLTRTGTVVGTPVYMAPEVAAGQPAEVASDLYSLAVMSYEMLAGKPPFEGENALSILHQHATRPVPPITQRLDYLPSGVDLVLEQGLAKKPAARPPTCLAFADLLAGQLAGDSRTPAPSDLVPTLEMARSPAVASPPAAAGPAATPTATGDAHATVHASSGTWPKLRQWALAGLVGAVVAVAGFLALRGNQRDPAVVTDAAEPGRISAPAVAAAPSAGREAPADAVLKTQPQAQPAPADPGRDSVPPPATPADSPPAVPGSATPPPAQPAVDPPAARSDPPSPPGRAGLPSSAERMRFNALRAFTSRSTESDFRRAQEAARRLPDHGPAAGQAAALAAYARGGMAYLEGDDTAAAADLERALGNQRFVAFWGPSPLMLLAAPEPERDAFEDWELALGYGDPRASAGAALDELLRRRPEDAHARFARALVHRLDGEHQAVIRHAEPLFQRLDAGGAPEARSYLAQIVAGAYLGLGRGDEALEWYRRAFEAGGTFRGVAAMRAAEAALQIQRSEVAGEFLRRGCEADFQPACRRLRSTQRLSRDRH